ncbi:MAG: type II toxin-antitoxin system Phd/YefM family antitoxin [Treponema sp.]|nr:type II toxin-antitoxin system Phd/YefM family antitoxin [Treponema sp.]
MLAAQFNALNTLKLIDAIIPITRFNKGEAGKIIDEVQKNGPRIIVKNNVPECVMISIEDYNALTESANRTAVLNVSKKAEEKRKAFIKKIRANVQPPLPPQMSVEERIEFLKKCGPIDVDEDAVNELRRISTL